MKQRVLAGYGVLMLALIGGTLFLPDNAWVQTFWQLAIGWLASAAVLFGIRLNRPAWNAPWLLFAAGVFLNASGVLVEQIVIQVVHHDIYPTPADGLWLALYPCLAVGMALLIRRMSASRDWSMMMDSSTITTGLGLLCWIYAIEPTFGDRLLTTPGHVVVALYPIGDVALLAMLVRLLVGGAGKNAALRLIGAALLMFLVGDVLWMVWKQIGWTPEGVPNTVMGMIFLVAFALVGAAALHPSVTDLGRDVLPVREVRASPAMLTALAGASLIAPIVLAVEGATGHTVDTFAISLASAVLFLLVTGRIVGLLRQVQAQARALRELARVDALTGLPNRRAWSSELPTAMDRARRDRTPLCVAMIDLDFFKRFNDEFGHLAGDRLLKGAAAAWQGEVRSTDLLARYGGEEFILLLPQADEIEAAETVERLRLVTPAGQTFSCGIAVWDGSEISEELLARADAALYRAKETGRNRTSVSDAASAATT
jgi:diguanylate cyclase (GGDEF)-like protein